MPDLAGNIEEIQNSLKASLGRGHDNLDQNVVAASKRVLLQNIEFKPASAPYSLQCNALKAKYTSLNPASATPSKPTCNGAPELQQRKSEDKEVHKAGMEGSEESLPRPKVILYPEELVKMDWTARTPSRIGAGLVNMGNTCFFNSSLQCLTYTAPLVNYCMTGDHGDKCKKKDFCMMCEIQVHIRTSLGCGGRSIKPHSMLQKLRCIAKHMKWGRQEDAHEFLRFVVDHLQQSCLIGENKLDRLSKETTVINQIFGGYLRSQVTCLRCQAKSNTFDPFMDLSLDIKGVNTVEDALAKFVKPETLDNENAYKCPKCRNKVRAHKRFSIQKPPNILTLQLNRFDFNRHLSGKINRFIKYPERINLRNYMSQRQGEPVYYHLYGVLVHSGHSSDCGHYYSYVKSPSKTWYCMNDSIVHQANYQSVFSADAYVLFYARVNRSSSSSSTNDNSRLQSKSLVTQSKNSFIGPTLPNHMKQDKSPLTNGIHGKSSSEFGTPIPRQQKNASLVPSTTPKIISHTSSLPDSHKKISFPILTPQQKRVQQQQEEEKEDGKHIVLQIKHGNSTTMEKSPDGKAKVVNGNISILPWHQKTTGLVPYNDDDDSDAEQENKSMPTPSSSSSKFTNSTSSAIKKLKLDDPKGGDSSGESLVHDGLPVPNGKNNHLSQQPSWTKSPFVWEESPPPKKSTSKPCDKENGSGSKHLSDSQIPTPSAKVISCSHHKSQSDLLDDRDMPRPNISHTYSTSPQKTQSKPHLALDLPVASGSKVKTVSSGTWYIHPHEGAPSPRGSCSSTNSVNSTSEWTVETKDKVSQAKDKNASQELSVNCNTNNCHSEKLSASLTPDSTPKRKSIPISDNSHVRSNTQSPQTESKKTVYGKNSESDRPKAPIYDNSLTPVVISDKQPLVSPASSQSSEGSSKNKLKRKHKPQNNFRDRSSSSPSDSSSKKLKKKKKKSKKHKKEKDKEDKKRLVSDDSDSDSESGVSVRKKMKRKEIKWSREEPWSSSSSGSEEGYEWVEKTIESPATKGKVNQVCVQSWNHHVKDDLSTPKLDDEEVKPKKTKTWDGARHCKVEKELQGTVSSQDYRSQVLSWDGGKSQLSKDLAEEKEYNQKRSWSDEYNEELDAGKVKKVKKQREDTGYGPSYNPFQEYHVSKKKSFKEEPETSWSRDHSYYHRRDNHQQDNHHHPRHNHCNNDNKTGYNSNNYSRHNWHDKSYNNKYNGSNHKVNGGRKFFK